jgi:hypothetical protein
MDQRVLQVKRSGVLDTARKDLFDRFLNSKEHELLLNRLQELLQQEKSIHEHLAIYEE